MIRSRLLRDVAARQDREAAERADVEFVLALLDALDLDEVQVAIARSLAGRMAPPVAVRRPSPPGRGPVRTPTRKGAP
ncbi:hypothetical protein [Pseudonocardia sp. T1-2H]|uniref:hypothetical protein n=1 Tax=Pseudonocardia sp. T1-2H TaxID=3128899 RepID=UPI0031011D84